MADPIDTSRIENWEQIYEKFRTTEGINSDGKVYGVPFSWGAISFMYRKDRFDTPPTSIAALWDPALKGRIALWDDKSAIYVAARLNGDTDIYNLTDEQIAAAQETLPEASSRWCGNTGQRRASWSICSNPTRSGYRTPGRPVVAAGLLKAST